MEVGIEDNRDFTDNTYDITTIRRDNMNTIAMLVMGYQVASNLKYFCYTTVLPMNQKTDYNFHTKTMTIRSNVTDHLSLLNIIDLVTRIDAEAIHTVVNKTCSS